MTQRSEDGVQGNMAGEVEEAGPVSEQQSFPGQHADSRGPVQTKRMLSRLRTYPSPMQSNGLRGFIYFFPISIDVWEV